MTYEELLSRFDGVKRRGPDAALARCPCHKDDEASLQISRGDHGRLLLKCMAGCDTGAILDRVGVTWADIRGDTDRPCDWKSYLERCMSKDGKRYTVTDRYDYRHIDGRYAFTKIRTDPKSFRYGKIDGDRWIWESVKRGGIPPALYTDSIVKLRESIEDGTRVFIVEGEKDVKTLSARGYVAVTVGGASDWDSRYADIFNGGSVVILGDNDEAGRKFAEMIRHDLENVTGSVKVVYPSEVYKGDVTDYFESGASKDDFEVLLSRSEQPVIDLEQFHTVTAKGCRKVNRNAIAEYLIRTEHIIVIGDIPYIYENGVYVQDKRGARIMTKAKRLMYEDLRDPSHMNAVFSMIETDADLIVAPNAINLQPQHWICFENGYYDPIGNVMRPHDPKYRTINKIPHRYDPNAERGRDVTDEYLENAMPDEETREMVLQYCGLCMTCDTRQQKMLILDGIGGTGKSTLIGLLVKAVGDANVSNVPLKNLSERFASYDLHMKLLNSCADIDTSAVTDVSVVKQLTGEDKLRGESKGKDAISFNSYAKILFSVNGLPIIQGERTDGFYRRALIAKFPVKPDTPDETLPDRLRENIDTFIDRAVKALRRMYAAGRIAESQASREAVRLWQMDGDSVEAWSESRLYRIEGVKTERKALYDNYAAFCRDNERTEVSSTTFYRTLRSKGYSEKVIHGTRFFEGVSLTAVKVVPEAFKDLIGRHI